MYLQARIYVYFYDITCVGILNQNAQMKSVNGKF